jgi:hypothetical protein
MESSGQTSAPTGGNGHGDDRAPADAFRDASARIAELKEYASYYVAAKVDSAKASARSAVLYAMLGVVGALIGIGLLVTAAVFFLEGLAGAIGALFPEGHGWWAGRLIVGVVVIAGALGGVWIVMKRLTGSSRKRTVEKYEARQRDERAQFGRDVQERARE